MANLLIKICGITQAELASQTALAGADFIGIVFHPYSKRFVEVDQAKEIAAAVIQQQAVPVAVFVDQTAEEMQRICEATHITTVQLHGSLSRATHHLLPAHYHRIYVQPISSSLVTDEEQGLRHCDAKRDFVLFDSAQAGKGNPFLWSQLPASISLPWFLAGGLSQQNVGDAIMRLHPHGIDVSSGVENTQGKKELSLIQAFITAARAATRGHSHE